MTLILNPVERMRSLQLNPEDDCLFGKVQYIPSLISYEGNTLMELKASFQEAISAKLSTANLSQRKAHAQPHREMA